jgi:hypothetical protein
MERNFAWLPLQILVGAVSDGHSRANGQRRLKELVSLPLNISSS